MTYEQSLQNIENIKNFVLPYSDWRRVFFDFKNEITFQAVFYIKCTSQEVDKLRADALNRNCPYAAIVNDKNEMPILSYIDDNLMMTYNILLNEMIHFDKIEPIDKNKLRDDFMSLIKHLKNT